MEGGEDCQWVDMMIVEIGYALSKVDETIQKSIMLWTELTKDMFDDQRTKELTGQPNNVISGEEHSSEDKSAAEVKERPIQHWALRFAEVNEELVQQHLALCALKVEELGEDHHDDHDGNDDDYDCFDDEDGQEEEDTTASECSEVMWELNLGASAMAPIEEDRGSSLRCKGGYELLKDVSTSSEEDYNLWDDGFCNNDYYQEEEEDETTDSKSYRDIWEEDFDPLEMPPSLQYYYNYGEDTGSSLRWKGDYELLKYDLTSSEEDDDELEDEMFCKSTKVDAITESLLGLDDEDDVSDKLQGFVDLSEEGIANDSEVETLLPECDWVYVTKTN